MNISISKTENWNNYVHSISVSFVTKQATKNSQNRVLQWCAKKKVPVQKKEPRKETFP